MGKKIIFALIGLFLGLLLFVGCNSSFNKKGLEKPFEISISKIKGSAPSGTFSKPDEKIFQNYVSFGPKPEDKGAHLFFKEHKGAWQAAKYLVIEVVNPNDYMTNVILKFYHERSHLDSTQDMHVSLGTMPSLPTQLIFPLSYLNGQEIYLPRFPRQLKGRAMGRSIPIENLGGVRLTLDPLEKREFASKMLIKKVYLSSTLPNPLPKVEKPIVDESGQWMGYNWTGKSPGVEETGILLNRYAKEVEGSEWPENWSTFGGYKGKAFVKSGYFKTEFWKNKWYLVDPDGYAFLSVGVTSINSRAGATTVTGNEDLFKWLPDTSLTKFYRKDKKGNLMVDFYNINLRRAFGDTKHQAEWENLTKNQLKAWRFNTVANWSDTGFAKRAKMPYVLPMTGAPKTKARIFRDFPDVYDPTFKDSCNKFASQLEKIKTDKFLIGYFLGNEPEWAFGNNNIALEMICNPSGKSFSRKELRDRVFNKFKGNVKNLNERWGLKLQTIESLDSIIIKDRHLLTDSARKDLYKFSEEMVDVLYSTIGKATKNVAPNHLNLGIRFAWISSPLCYVAGKHFDVFSLNGYNSPGPPDTKKLFEKVKKPVIIGEFHFGALDRGLPSTGIRGVRTQADRGWAYRYYVENGFSRPEIVGIHYFTMYDQPIMGRFDGENYNIGIVDVTGRPHVNFLPELIKANENIYYVGMKIDEPYPYEPQTIPPIY